MKFFTIILITFTFLTVLLPSSQIAYAKPQAQAEKEDSEELDIDYKSYITNPKKLGFSPNLNLFKSAYMLLKTKHIDVCDDSQILNSCKKEVNKLLKVGGLKQNFNPQSLGGVEQAIEQNATAKVSRDLLWFAAIEGMLQAMNDPYTVLLPPKEYATLQEQTQITYFGGIGVFLEQDKNNGNKLTVFEPIEGTPAYRAGLMPEDHIVSIDGEQTKELPIELSMAKMRGDVGTNVTLVIQRKGEPKLLTFKLKREKIKIQAVNAKLIDGKYGYIRIRTFGDNTSGEFAKAIQALSNKNISGLIIDLRNNGGGLIESSIDICSQLIPAGNNVVSTQGRSGNRQYYKSSGNVYLPKMPITVLINKYSASASEITAGALQDYGIAKLIGGKSYGKGSVQEVIPLSNGGAFKITMAHYFTPKNRNINNKGIMPDIKSEMDVRIVGKQKGDTQLQRAVQFLKTGQ